MKHTRRGLFQMIGAAIAGRRCSRALQTWIRKPDLREQYLRGKLAQHLDFQWYVQQAINRQLNSAIEIAERSAHPPHIGLAAAQFYAAIDKERAA